MNFEVKNDKLSVSVKAHGAELSSVKSLDTGFEYLWQGNPDVWYGQSPVLFPIVGTLYQNKYYVDGKEYEMFRHGIARKREFELKEQGENYFVLTQKYNEDTLKVYPYRYIFDIEYRLDGKKLTVTHTIRNEGDGDMYFSIGAHPGFNCEIDDVLEFDTVEDEVINEMINEDAVIIKKHFPSPIDGKIFTISKNIFDADAHVLSNLKSKTCTLKGKNLPGDVEFTFGDCPFLGLWAKPGAPYVCIEPWYGVNDFPEKTDDFSHKRAIQKISGDEAFSFSWSAEIKE